MSLRVVFIDNFDSFTWNLVDEFAKRGAEVEVWRNTVTAVHALQRAESGTGPSLLVLSPGPGEPKDAGCCMELVRLAEGRVPLFGVCLGHQAMIEAYGGVIGSAGEILHGKTSSVEHEGGPLFEGLPSPLTVGRYHSLGAFTVPAPLQPVATGGALVMAVSHSSAPMLGVQFHPESILTPLGSRMIANVIRWAEAADAGR
ncbi:MAG: aminodeoxychorismate/anthranilate synthase component II [Gemmatimonadota bacterium]|nr:aminodeoxychorismate/anthranilate synthase component II [Gemmatimonadota bacterium]